MRKDGIGQSSNDREKVMQRQVKDHALFDKAIETTLVLERVRPKVIKKENLINVGKGGSTSSDGTRIQQTFIYGGNEAGRKNRKKLLFKKLAFFNGPYKNSGAGPIGREDPYAV